MLRLSSTYLQPFSASTASEVVGAVPGSGPLLDTLATLRCGSALDDILDADDELRAVDVLALRKRWLEHCAQEPSLARPRGYNTVNTTAAAAVAFAAPLVIATPSVAQAAHDMAALGTGLFSML